MSSRFKKLVSLILGIVMTLSFSVAFAADDNTCPHDTPQKYSKQVKITIYGTNDPSGESPDKIHLPSEYHIRVIWNVLDGVYNATRSDDKIPGQKNFSWDCASLEYKVNSYTPPTGGTDFRTGNWVATPKVAFEVTNASTPDKTIYVTPSLDGDDNWSAYLNASSIADQNRNIGKKTVSPVKRENMGTGVNSYEGRSTANHPDRDNNVYAYTYTLNWNYDNLNKAALDAYKNATGNVVKLNTFVLTVSAN